MQAGGLGLICGERGVTQRNAHADVRRRDTQGCQQRNVARWNQEEDSPSVSWNRTTWKLPWLPVEEERGGEERWRSTKTVLGREPARKKEGIMCLCQQYSCASVCKTYNIIIKHFVLVKQFFIPKGNFLQRKKSNMMKYEMIHYTSILKAELTCITYPVSIQLGFILIILIWHINK